ncbi:hypothetical protein EUGRSUZ_E00289 [Eucalyptus grandis]|uniref:Uncharacterized protein n=2 Tax=Eucalyptus grandis TaxID=71139 RepID=A0A059C1L4_EUCGR|nr:hypothetical protein EUGRSUZ_E00289 [Eucalyptus grandis]
MILVKEHMSIHHELFLPAISPSINISLIQQLGCGIPIVMPKGLKEAATLVAPSHILFLAKKNLNLKEWAANHKTL